MHEAQAPQPPHKTVVYHANGVTYHVTEPYEAVRAAIKEAYSDTDPFIDLTDNYGRPLSVPVGHIIAVLSA